MKRLIVLFFTVFVTYIDWPDVPHTKNSVVIVHYSDGTYDRVVVDKKYLKDANVDHMYEEITKIIDLKIKEKQNGSKD